MKYRKLGRTGFDVSEIGHGLWGMSGWSGSEDEGSRESLQLSASLGCNFFDTAWAYGDGKSDALLGELLARNYGKRQSAAAGFSSHIYAASKIPPMNRKWPASPQDDYAEVFPAKHVLKYVELIRDKLGVDSIDLLQFHVWDDRWAREPEFKRTVGKLKTEGLIRAFGLSLNRWEPENGIAALRTGLVDVVQVIYNIFDQSPEEKLFPVCKELNIGVIARVPLDEGSLGGKMTPADTFPPNDFRARYFGPENLQRHAGARGKVEGDSARGNEPAGNGHSIHSVESRRKHNHYRNEEAGECPSKCCLERCWPARRGIAERIERTIGGIESRVPGRLERCRPQAFTLLFSDLRMCQEIARGSRLPLPILRAMVWKVSRTNPHSR